MQLTFIALESDQLCYYSNKTAGVRSIVGTLDSLPAPSSKHAPGAVPVALLSCISLLYAPHDAAHSGSICCLWNGKISTMSSMVYSPCSKLSIHNNEHFSHYHSVVTGRMSSPGRRGWVWRKIPPPAISVTSWRPRVVWELSKTPGRKHVYITRVPSMLVIIVL